MLKKRRQGPGYNQWLAEEMRKDAAADVQDKQSDREDKKARANVKESRKRELGVTTNLT